MYYSFLSVFLKNVKFFTYFVGNYILLHSFTFFFLKRIFVVYSNKEWNHFSNIMTFQVEQLNKAEGVFGLRIRIIIPIFYFLQHTLSYTYYSQKTKLDLLSNNLKKKHSCPWTWQRKYTFNNKLFFQQGKFHQLYLATHKLCWQFEYIIDLSS